MQPCSPERFVCVDVSDPSQEDLIGQERLQAAAAPGEVLAESLQGERRIQWLRAEFEDVARAELLRGRTTRQRCPRIDARSAEFADVAKAQLTPVGQLENQVDEAVLRRSR